MDVLRYISDDGRITIQAATASDIKRLWQRFRARVGEEKALTYCEYVASQPGKLTLASTNSEDMLEVGDDWSKLPPVFYETAVYNFSLRFSNLESAPVITHKLKEITELFTAVNIGGNDWLLAAPLDFLNEPGIFELAFKYKPSGEKERTDSLTFRVVSPKLDTKDDYNYILNDINREYNEIVFQYLTKTFQNLSRGGRSNNDVVWLSIFRDVAEQYIKAVTYIVNRPHLRETCEVRHSRPDRIKRWTPDMARRFKESEADGTLETSHFRHEITETTTNTRENRFVKFTLDRISRRLEVVFRNIRANASKKGSEIDPSELAELDNYLLRLRKLSNSSLLRNLRGEPLRSESMVLQKRTGYAQIYRYWLMLQKGIELFEGSNNIGVRPVWELYELWCFLKMRSMVAEILGLDFSNPEEILEIPMVMIEPFSDSSAKHTVQYFLPSGDEIRLHYQHEYHRESGEVHTATTENRPDIVLTVRKPSGFELTYLYDAKYRVTDDDKLSRLDEEEARGIKEGADYPPTDAINQMHRYRDAIYYGEKQDKTFGFAAKEIIGGYILFPGRGDDNSIKQRYYYKSIESVNIGAFPLLPDHRNPSAEGTLLHQHLVKILTTPQVHDHVKDSIPQRGLEYHSAETPHEDDLVLVGYYRSDQWEAINNSLVYYVRIGSGGGSITPVYGYEKTKYLLLHHGENRLLVNLDVSIGPKIYSQAELKDLKFNPRGNFYLGFKIKSMKPVTRFNLDEYEFERKGKYRETPHFTTISKISSL